jgi:type III secretory pathway component EscV
MAPRAKPKLVQLSPEVEASVRVGVEQAERGEFANMTPEETERYLETGELPEHVERWLESYDSHSVT